MNIYIINGSATSGKSTFCKQVCRLIYPYGEELSTVDLVKKLAQEAGWDGKKTPEARRGLSNLKDVLTVWLDAPVNDIKKSINNKVCWFDSYGMDIEKLTFFINVREPDEIRRLCKEFNAKSIRVIRDVADNAWASNHADADVKFYDYDIYIDNNEGLEQLAMTALDFVKKENLPLRKGTFKFDENWNFKYNNIIEK
jgi:hypothetical protein